MGIKTFIQVTCGRTKHDFTNKPVGVADLVSVKGQLMRHTLLKW